MAVREKTVKADAPWGGRQKLTDGPAQILSYEHRTLGLWGLERSFY